MNEFGSRAMINICPCDECKDLRHQVSKLGLERQIRALTPSSKEEE